MESIENGVDVKTIQKRYEGKSYDEWMKGYLSFLDPVFVSECADTLSKSTMLTSTKGKGNIVELAVGSGRNIHSGNYNLYSNIDVLGFDMTEGMLEIAKQKVRMNKLDNIKLEYSDIRQITSKIDKNFSDLTVMTYGLCVTPNPEIVLQNILDVTKPGGLIYIADYVFAQHPTIQKEQEEITPLTKVQGMRFYEAKQNIPTNEKTIIDYEHGAILPGHDNNGHSIVWDATFDLRKLIANVFGNKVKSLKVVESEKDKVQSNLLFLGQKR